MQATKLHCDNVSAIAMTKNPVFHARTKHIEMRYHFIRELVKQNEINLHYVETQDQPANIFTKPVSFEKLKMFNSDFGITDYERVLKSNQQF